MEEKPPLEEKRETTSPSTTTPLVDSKTDHPATTGTSPNIKRRNIRAGFVAAPTLETDSQAHKDRIADSKKKKRAGGKSHVQVPNAFLSSDFRKKRGGFST